MTINKSFRFSKLFPLIASQITNSFNDNAFKNAFIILLTFKLAKIHHLDAQLIATIASSLFIIPFLIFSGLISQIVSKFSKSLAIKCGKILELILVITASFAFYYSNIAILLMLFFLMGLNSVIFTIAKYSLIPESFKKEDLTLVNGIMEGLAFIFILVGNAFGGIFINNDNGIIIISIAIFITAIIGLISSLFIPNSINNQNLKINYNIFTNSRQIIIAAKNNKDIWRLLLLLGWFWFVAIIFLSQFPIFTKNIIHGNEELVIMFFMIFSLSIAIGSAICGKIKEVSRLKDAISIGLRGIFAGLLIFIAGILLYENYQLPKIILNNGSEYLLSISEFIKLPIAMIIIAGLVISALFCGIYTISLYSLIQSSNQISKIADFIATSNVINAIFMILATSSITIMNLFKIELTTIFILLAILHMIVIICQKINPL